MPRPNLRFRPALEPLEERAVPTTVRLVGTTLTIRGTPGPDDVRVDYGMPLSNGRQIVAVRYRGGPRGGLLFTTDRITRIEIKTLEGNDRVEVGARIAPPGSWPTVGESVQVDLGVGRDYISVKSLIFTPRATTTLRGGPGDDTLVGGSAVDFLFGDAGNDRVYGGTGNDVILTGLGDDFADGGSGHDRVDGGAGNDTALGGAGNDTILGGAGDDNVNGGTGNDRVDGGLGRDTVNGGAGQDTLRNGEAGEGRRSYFTINAVYASNSLTHPFARIHGFVDTNEQDWHVPFHFDLTRIPDLQIEAADIFMRVKPLGGLSNTDHLYLKGDSGKAASVFSDFHTLQQNVYQVEFVPITDVDVFHQVTSGRTLEGLIQDDTAVSYVKLRVTTNANPDR